MILIIKYQMGLKLVEKQTIIKISGSNKQLVGSVAAKIKSFKKTEPYKGKGIKKNKVNMCLKKKVKEIMKINTVTRKKV